MTTSDLNIPVFTDDELAALAPIAPGEPVRMVPDNPWDRWLYPVGGATIGSWLAGSVTVALDSPYLHWAVGTGMALTLASGVLAAVHDRFEVNPTRFKPAA